MTVYFILVCTVYLISAPLASSENLRRKLCTGDQYILETELSKFQNCFHDGIYTWFKNIMTNDSELETSYFEMCEPNLTRTCITNFRDAVDICLVSEAEQVVRRDAIKAALSFSRFVCDKDAEAFRDFREDAESKACLRAKDREIHQCNKNYVDLPKLQYTWIRLIYRFNSDCELQGELTECLYDTLDECDNKIARDFYKGLHMSVLRSTRCKSIIQEKFPSLVDNNSPTRLNLNTFILSINILMGLKSIL